MNFRGSTGYGKEFWTKSFKQWGGTMQDDVTDGVKWLISEGIADPDRIGIYGGSYGGYATLAGVTFTPDLYACAVDYVGVSNIFTWMEAFPPYWEPFIAMVYEMVGDPATEPDFIRSISPFFHVDKIEVPMLVAQGANDPRVKKDESDQIVAALQGARHRRASTSSRTTRATASPTRRTASSSTARWRSSSVSTWAVRWPRRRRPAPRASFRRPAQRASAAIARPPPRGGGFL